MGKIVGLIMLLGIVACTKPKNLEFVDIQNIRMVKWGLTESQIGLDIRFYNPNNQRVQLKDAVAKVYVNSTYLGDTEMDTTISVPRRDTFAIPLLVNIKTLSAVSKVVQSLSDSTVLIKVEGTVKMGKAGIFRTFPVNYERNEKISALSEQLNR